MAMKAKHAFGALENIDAAIASGKVDAYDILFVKDAQGKPYVGWVDKNGNKVVVDDSKELAALEDEIAKKANATEVAALETELANKASAEEVETLGAEVATKVDAATVQVMIKEYSSAVIEVVEF